MALITKSFTFSTGNTIVASEINTNYDTIYDEINGSLNNANLASNAAIANTKLANPNAFFTMAFTAEGQYTATVDPLFTFQMPFAATLVEVSASARDIDTVDGNETYDFDLEEAGTSVLSTNVLLTADNTPVVGVISDSSIADNAKMQIVMTLGGTSPAIDDITVLLTFKVGHTT